MLTLTGHIVLVQASPRLASVPSKVWLHVVQRVDPCGQTLLSRHRHPRRRPPSVSTEVFIKWSIVCKQYKCLTFVVWVCRDSMYFFWFLLLCSSSWAEKHTIPHVEERTAGLSLSNGRRLWGVIVIETVDHVGVLPTRNYLFSSEGITMGWMRADMTPRHTREDRRGFRYRFSRHAASTVWLGLQASTLDSAMLAWALMQPPGVVTIEFHADASVGPQPPRGSQGGCSINPPNFEAVGSNAGGGRDHTTH